LRAAQRRWTKFCDERGQEVATVKIMLMTGRPSALSAARTPVSVARQRSVSAAAHASVVGIAAVRSRTCAVTAPLSQVHQAQVQAELATVLVRAAESYGITGFMGNGIEAGKQQLVDGARGVPPRGRPV
jgi:hypothetical protein